MSGTVLSSIQTTPITNFSRKEDHLVKEMISEFVGTLLLVHIGTCVNAQYFLSQNAASSALVIIFGWGLAVMFAVTMSYSVSGGLINPSVTVLTWALGKLPLRHVIPYAVAQTSGAFCGAGLTFAIYYAAINNYDGGIRSVVGIHSTAIIFIPFPSPYLGIINGVIDSIMSTIILCLTTAAIGDERNKLPSFLIPLFSGIIVMMMGSGYGMNAGSPINPARDLGPRIFLLCAGYGWETFGHDNWQWFWIPIVGPLIGSLIASWLYKMFTKSVKPGKPKLAMYNHDNDLMCPKFFIPVPCEQLKTLEAVEEARSVLKNGLWICRSRCSFNPD